VFVMRPSFLSLLKICALLVVFHGCGVGHQAEAPSFTAPEEALDYYIEGLRAGDLNRIIHVTHPPATDYYLPGPAKIVDYEIVDKRILSAEEAAKDVANPPSRAGDVALDVREVTTDNVENMFTYWFRKIGESWKLYAWSGWGTDDFCYEC
jgi:hypothetical protein